MVGDSEKRGLLYVVINSIVANIWKWSCCYALIEPDDEEDELENNYSPLLKDNDEQNQQNQIVEKKPKYVEKTFKDKLKSVINMPLITSIFSLCITFSPSLQRLFITPKAILRDTIIDVNMTVSKAYSFIVIFILGLSIADNVHLPGEEVKKIGKSFLNASILFWLSLVKLVIMPILSTPVIIYLFRNILTFRRIYKIII